MGSRGGVHRGEVPLSRVVHASRHQGVLKDGGTGRRKAVDALAKSLGGSVESMYWAFGSDDFFVIADPAQRGCRRRPRRHHGRVRRGLDQHGRAAHGQGHRRRRQAPSRLSGARRQVAAGGGRRTASAPARETAPGRRAPALHSAAMDLHVIGPLATPVERAAVDAVLGPPESGWVGGRRDAANQGHASTGGHAIRARRSQLLPALHAVQSRVGWISQPALNYISSDWPCRPPRRTASRRSTPCTPPSRARRSSPTSATTSRAGSPAPRPSAVT